MPTPVSSPAAKGWRRGRRRSSIPGGARTGSSPRCSTRCANGREGRLRGETPEERFASFVAILRDPAEALEILRRYPVLARDACLYSEQWAEASLEMME